MKPLVRLAVACVVVVIATPGAGAARELRIDGPYGSGAAATWILRPAGPIRSVVVFGHGWKAAAPSSARPWVRQFGPWLEHLVAGGSAVVFPRYQLGGETPGPAFVDAYRRGLRRGFSILHTNAPVVAMGYSVGATLALYYAADAVRWGLPRPSAVDAVFPAGLALGVPPPTLPPAVSVLVQVGDRDTLAGRPAAAPIWAWLGSHARKRYDVVASTGSFIAVHAAPKETTAAARRAFWAPLDALVASAR